MGYGFLRPRAPLTVWYHVVIALAQRAMRTPHNMIYLNSVSGQGYIGEKHAMRPSSIKHDACAHAVTAPPCIIHVWMRWRKNWSTTKNKMRQGKGSIDRISARRSPAQTPSPCAFVSSCLCGRLISSVSLFSPSPRMLFHDTPPSSPMPSLG
ncbi:hypothetical protein DER45DRAFT_553412 [Fusarium avenaceum]|nr:hypothetical protein DER45DRAFT_553412 [Fusarium avenaceum]